MDKISNLAHMTCSPMVRDFLDETGVGIMYMDMMIQFALQKGMKVYLDGVWGCLSDNPIYDIIQSFLFLQ